MMEKIEVAKPGSIHIFEVQSCEEGLRIDSFVAKQFPSYSRSFFEKLIEREHVKLNTKTINKKSTPLKACDIIEIKFPELKKETTNFKNKLENLDVKIVYQHKHFFILSKPDNLMVHAPHPDSTAVTLVDWAIAHLSGISDVGFDDRPGIVHRLDKDTTGLIIIPRNNCSHAYFSDLFKKRNIKKTYLAIVKGHPDKTGEIDLDIARNPFDKNKMTHVTSGNIAKIRGKIRKAKTLFNVLEYFDEYSLVEAKPVTGRTHQIRVHFAGIGHPILGDPVYNDKSKIIPRQALHAHTLEFKFEGEKIIVTENPPKDFQSAISLLKKNIF